jgi:hypothetical protein
LLFPIVIQVAVVAKFMCNRGLADRVVNFNNDYSLELMREPSNKHDPHAVKVIIGQLDSLLVDQVSL